MSTLLLLIYSPLAREDSVLYCSCLRQGLHPPAEVWLTFQKRRWAYLPFGLATGVFLLLLGGWYLRNAFREEDAAWLLVTLLAWACALPTVYLFIRKRAWWLWLLGLHGQETAELRWTWRVARPFGLRKPLDQVEIRSWGTPPRSSLCLPILAARTATTARQ